MAIVNQSGDYYTQVARGLIAGHEIVQKFGRNGAVGTSLAPVSMSGRYPTPTAATTLEVLSDNAGDTAAGAGAQQLTIEGLDGDFNRITTTVELNGTTAVALDTNFIRVFRWYVSRSGSYATESTPSHLGTLTLRESGGGATWHVINTAVAGFGLGQSQIAAYTVPAGKTAWLLSEHATIETNKVVSVFLFQRQNADDTVAPYSGTMRVSQQYDSVAGSVDTTPLTPLRTFPEKTDFGYMALVSSGTASVSVDFEILLIDNAV